MSRKAMNEYRSSVMSIAGHACRVAAIVLASVVGVAGCGSAVDAPGYSSGRPATAAGGVAVAGTAGTALSTTFTLTSPVMAEGGTLPVEFTCDGAAETPPLAWTGAPEGTAGYAIVMHTEPGPGDTHW